MVRHDFVVFKLAAGSVLMTRNSNLPNSSVRTCDHLLYAPPSEFKLFEPYMVISHP